MTVMRTLEGVILDELRQQRQLAAADLALFDTIIKALEGMSPDGRVMALSRLTRAFPPTPTASVSPSYSQPVTLDLRPLTYADAAETLLSRSKQIPLSTKILIVRMRLHGKKVLGSDPYRTLYRSLKNDARFLSLNGRWALAEWFPEDRPLLAREEKEAATEREDDNDES